MSHFIREKLEWFEPEASEREPDYTARVLAPQLSYFLSRTNSPFILRSDGLLRPQPVIYSGWSNYPDIAFNLGSERTIAVEVKFFSGASDKNALTTALGQAILYASGGYQKAFVMLVSRQAGVTIEDKDLQRIQKTMHCFDCEVFTLS